MGRELQQKAKISGMIELFFFFEGKGNYHIPGTVINNLHVFFIKYHNNPIDMCIQVIKFCLN